MRFRVNDSQKAFKERGANRDKNNHQNRVAKELKYNKHWA
jgi:hypothetical protein